MQVSIKSLFILIILNYVLLLSPLNAEIPESKVLYTKYKSFPKIAYTNQKIKTVISARIFNQKEKSFSIVTMFSNARNVERISQDLTWLKQEDGSYEITLEYKVSNKEFTLPQIRINLVTLNNKVIDSNIVKSPKISYRAISSKDKRYSNIIASSLSVDSIKIKQYKNNKLLVLLKLSAKNSNLENFKLLNFENQGKKDLELNEGIQTMYYYAIVPVFEKTIKFSYYNSNSNEFVLVSLPIILKEDLVSTQSDLNPYSNNMLMYKKMALAFMVFVFLVIYFFYRTKLSLAYAVVFMTGLIYLMSPNEKITIERDTKVYILPTKNSIIFKVIKNTQEAEVLIKNENFKKVLFEDENIGWIKND